MDKELVAWLNNPKREYGVGLDIFIRLSKNDRLKQQFYKDTSVARSEKLFAELRLLYYELKGINLSAPVAKASEPVKQNPEPAPTPKNTNPELEAACKAEADKAYKLLANTRAQLFALCHIKRKANENSDHAVKQREALALSIADMQPVVDELYSRYRYVQEHGCLPDKQEEKAEELPRNPILLERKRINLIKSINKLKLKEQTAERVALIQDLNNTLKIVTDGVNQFLEQQF